MRSQFAVYIDTVVVVIPLLLLPYVADVAVDCSPRSTLVLLQLAGGCVTAVVLVLGVEVRDVLLLSMCRWGGVLGVCLSCLIDLHKIYLPQLATLS